ncbi:SCP-like protein [Ancylostoma caninum]|uniref:SCP-like protein n=1 Tax=Ancylostoma caninum TaxID=29170 RepID=A0A368GVZ9_ANCCA|nr:SCP-like protein [Ancylostoma caninum]
MLSLHQSGSIRLGTMELAVLVVLLATLQLYANTATSATEFNCYNTLITDEWRQMVLDRHNELRRRLAQGNQRGKTANLPAGNLNKLNWDCQMEMLIDEKIGECNAKTATPANTAYGAAKEMMSIKGSEKCDATSITKTTLNKWWKDGAAIQEDNKVVADNSFSQMAVGAADGFACSYKRCGGKLFLVCFYNKKTPDPANPLYDITGGNCGSCPVSPTNPPNKVGCVEFLCQYPLQPGEAFLACRRRLGCATNR